MTTNKECQMGFDIVWLKMVLDSYLLICYNPNSYPIFIKKLKEMNKLTIPINHLSMNQELFFFI